MRPVRVRSVANAEIVEAFDWYRARSPQVAAHFLDEVDATMQRIAATPEAWPVVRGSMRRARVAHFPYGVFYRVFPTVISVLGVVHVRRHPRRWIRRG